MSHTYSPTQLVTRAMCIISVCMVALTLPFWYVITFGVVLIVGMGMYEAIIAGLLFDAIHAALPIQSYLGTYSVTVVFLLTTAVHMVVRKLLFHAIRT